MDTGNDLDIKIADLNVHVHCNYPYTKSFCADFAVAKIGSADISVGVTEAEIDAEERGFPQAPSASPMSRGYMESVCVHRAIAERLPEFDAFVFHGAAVNVNGKGCVFAARSGVGKTTHISLLLKNYPENVRIINGDKPIFRKTEGEWRVFSTPWAGKEGMKTNSSAPLSAIILLERSNENFIEEVLPEKYFDFIVKQVYMPRSANALMETLSLVDNMAKNVKFYRLGCNISPEAAETSYNMLK